jgi:hypothetical protein
MVRALNRAVGQLDLDPARLSDGHSPEIYGPIDASHGSKSKFVIQ